ncbi:MAG: T9SS type A sorting domain-containing protein [Flavobacteriales bacterium]|nr:T9SS type A sorting domain-containing protein [Flavobacteriales bacterium]
MERFIKMLISVLIVLPGPAPAQTIADGSFELAGAALGNGSSFTQYPTFMGGWASVNTDGECFGSGSALDGNWFADLLQNGTGNPDQFWDENGYAGFGNYDRIVTVISDLNPNSTYRIIFHESNQLDRFGYMGDRTLVQLQSVQTNDASEYLFDTPLTSTWRPDTILFSTDPFTTSAYLLFSPLGTINACVSLDHITITGTDPNTIASAPDIGRPLVYPNPAADVVTIEDGRGLRRIEVHDDLGRVVLTADGLDSDMHRLVLGALEVGIYELTIFEGNGRRVRSRLIRN